MNGSCNHCCNGKAISVTYWVLVALGIQHAVRHTVICGLSGSTICFHIISQAAWSCYGVIERKLRVLIFSTTFIGNISHSKKNWATYKKCLLAFISITSYSCHILKKLEFSQQTFYRYSNKFQENPSSVSRAVPNGRRKDTTKLIVVFRNSVNAAKKWKTCLLEKSDVLDECGQVSERCCGRTPLWWAWLNDYVHQEKLRPVEA